MKISVGLRQDGSLDKASFLILLSWSNTPLLSLGAAGLAKKKLQQRK